MALSAEAAPSVDRNSQKSDLIPKIPAPRTIAPDPKLQKAVKVKLHKGRILNLRTEIQHDDSWIGSIFLGRTVQELMPVPREDRGHRPNV